MKNFRVLSDYDYEKKWYKKIDKDRYHIVQILSLKEAGVESAVRYSVTLHEVNSAISVNNIKAALEFCGVPDNIKQNPLVIVESLHDYGCTVPLGIWEGNNYRKLLQIVKQESRRIQEDNSYYEEKMNSPVNAIGTTAREYQCGDFDSAIVRGLLRGDKNCWLMARIQGCKAEDLESAGFKNPLEKSEKATIQESF